MACRSSRIASFCVIAVLLCLAEGARSQIRVNTNLVVVPVSVRGTDGELVTDLTKDDFTILENGEPQLITNFDKDPAPLAAALVIDDGIGGQAIHRVAARLPVIAAGFTKHDEISVFRYDSSVDKLSDFSSDPKAMHKSFESIDKIASRRPQEQEELITGGPGWLRSVLGIFPDGSKGPAKNHVLHNAVYDAAKALGDRPDQRRRILFLISDGQVSGPANVHSLKQNTDLLLQNDVQVFAVSTDYASFGSFGALTDYAKATGGDVYGGATDSTLEHAFVAVTEQARHQYVLGFFSSNSKSKPGVLRTIVVKTNQAGMKVTHRKGYTR